MHARHTSSPPRAPGEAPSPSSLLSADATVSLGLTYFIAAGVSAGALLLVGLHARLWGWPRLTGDWRLWALAAVGVVVHEGLHGLGYWLGGASRSDVRFGIAWARLMPYAHCRRPLRARAYRRAVVLPGLVLGLLPALCGLATGAKPWALFGLIHLCLAGGDAAVLWSIRRLSPEALVRDHPTAVGCSVLSPPECVPGSGVSRDGRAGTRALGGLSRPEPPAA